MTELFYRRQRPHQPATHNNYAAKEVILKACNYTTNSSLNSDGWYVVDAEYIDIGYLKGVRDTTKDRLVAREIIDFLEVVDESLYIEIKMEGI